MLKKTIFGVLAAVTAFTAFPSAAQAQYYRDGYYGRYNDGYYRNRHRRHRSRTSVYIGVGPSYYGGYYGPSYGYYGPSYYGYYDPYYRPRYYRSYYRPRYYRDGYYGCGDRTTGALVGGAAGALVGREIGRDGRGYRYRYGRRGSGTTGAIIGGAIGALIGSEASRC